MIYVLTLQLWPLKIRLLRKKYLNFDDLALLFKTKITDITAVSYVYSNLNDRLQNDVHNTW